MLAAIGVESVDELFEQIPEPLRLDRPLDLPAGMSEAEVYERLAELAARNADAEEQVCFLGAGMYDHYVPAIVDAITQRSRVPDPVHALPARDLPGRPAGDVRVPDGDVGADRAAGLQRRPLRGPVLGGLGRLPGDRREQGAPPLRRLPRRPSAQPRDARHLRCRLRRRDRRGRARGRRHRRRRARRRGRRRDRRRLPPEPELPRRGRGRRGARRRGEGARGAAGRRRRPDDPRGAEAARRVRRRHRPRRGPAARQPARLRRSLVRLLLRAARS